MNPDPWKRFPSSNMTGSTEQKSLKALELIYDRLGSIEELLKTIHRDSQRYQEVPYPPNL